MEIINVSALEILDSRGNPTVEVNLTLEDGTEARAAVPSGAQIASMLPKRIHAVTVDGFLMKVILFISVFTLN